MKSSEQPVAGRKEELSEMIVNVLKSSLAAEPDKKIHDLAARIQRRARPQRPENIVLKQLG